MSPTNKQQRITLSYGQHRSEEVVWVDFAYNKDIADQIKAFGGRWSQSNKRWYISKKKFDLHAFFEAFKKSGFIDYSEMRSKNLIEQSPAANKQKPVEKEIVNLPKGYEELLDQKRYPHMLRHSFATHHLEQGTDLRYIQEWLGIVIRK